MSSSNDNDTFVIEIPATDFSPSSKRTLAPPPHRLTHNSAPSRRPTTARHTLAAANRAARIRSTKARCRQHIAHVTDVVNSIRESRIRTQSQRRHALHDQLIRAASRRSLIRQAARNPINTTNTNQNDMLFKPSSASSSTTTTTTRTTSPSSVLVQQQTDDDDDQHLGQHHQSSDLQPRTLNFDDPSQFSHNPVPPSQHQTTVQFTQRQRSAAAMIAAHVLLSRARHLLRHTGLQGPALHRAPFEAIADRMLSSTAITAAQHVLRAVRLLKVSRQRPRSSSPSPSPSTVPPVRPRDCRILISAIIIALHPSVAAAAPSGQNNNNNNNQQRHIGTVVSDARILLLFLSIRSVHRLAVQTETWTRVYRAWKTPHARSLTDPLIAEAVALDAQNAMMMSSITAATDVASMQRVLHGGNHNNNVNSDTPSSSSSSATATEWTNAMEQRQRALRENVRGVGGSAAVARLDAARRAHARDVRMRELHDLQMDSEGVANRLCMSTEPPNESVWDDLRLELRGHENGKEGEALATRLAFVSRLLNGMLPGCFAVPIPHDQGRGGLTAEYAQSVVEAIYNACHKCQAAAQDGALLVWRDESRKRFVDATRGQDVLADAVTDALKRGTELASAAYRDVVRIRVEMAAAALDNGTNAGIEAEREWYRERVREGEFENGLPVSVNWLGETFSSVGGNGDMINVVDRIGHGVRLLVLREEKCTRDTVPEVLWLDAERLAWMQNEMQMCIVAVALDQLARQTVRGRNVRLEMGTHGPGEELLRLCGKEEVRVQELQQCVIEWVEGKGVMVSEEEAVTLQGMVKRVGSGVDAVFDVVARRMGEVLKAREKAEGGRRSGEMERMFGAGLEKVEEKVMEVRRVLWRMCVHVVAVHEQVVRQVVEQSL